VGLADLVPMAVVDYEERVHRLGIHLFPSSNSPFVMCVGFLFLGIAAVPLPGPVRLGLGALGLVIFLVGLISWVVVEDFRMYEDVVSHDEGSHGEDEGPSVATGHTEEARS